MTNPNQNRSVLELVRRDIAGAAKQPESKPESGSSQTQRKQSDFWLNIGVTIPGGGKEGEDLFVSLPVGLAIDDMKPMTIKGQNEDWIALAQAKNALLDQLQKAAANMQPGDRCSIPQLSVEIYRRAEPAQQGSPESNSLVASVLGALGTKTA